MFFGKIVSVRADRLVSLVLLLRQRGRMKADELASALEVSTRTVLRDIEALSTAGVPVYADRGRYGGFSLLPGFRTELTGLNHEEALALLTASSARGEQVFGLGSALASAMRKVVDALPEGQRAPLDDAARRFLVEPAVDLLSRRADTEDLDDRLLRSVRRAVVQGRKLRFDYATPQRAVRSHDVDPIGLVTVRDRTYLLALVGGADRTYRLVRMARATVLDAPADRPADADLETLWAERAARFLAEKTLTVQVRVAVERQADLVRAARGGRVLDPGTRGTEPDGTVLLELAFDDLRHALWAVWPLDLDAEVIEPEHLRQALAERAALLASRYGRAAS